MKRKINCETVRNFSVEKALKKLGHFPKRTTEKEAWFLSPFRSETQASFKVSRIKNRWYDHGVGIGGNVIDLVSKILKCSIKETLEFLSDNNPVSQKQPQDYFNQEHHQISIIKTEEITHPALTNYLQTRNIPLAIAKRYCKEVWYSYKGRSYFAIGLKNDLGGWELRNKIFKNSSSPKSYTQIKTSSKQLVIVEGMFDLLSLAVLNNNQIRTSDIIVLNSIAFIKEIEHYINHYKTTSLYLDNDVAGDKATKYLINNYKSTKDQRYTYKSHKDLNEYLCYEI